MNVDEARVRQYFTSRSATIELPSSDPSSITARAGARRRRRRSAGTGVVALTLVAAALGVQQRGTDGGQVTADSPATMAADPLEWTTVVPQAGLSSATSVVGTDGTMFGLSTAPGRHAPDDPTAFQRTLYRSADGVEWSTVPLPSNLSPSRLAMNGDQLYAVGTAPAGGGGRSLVLARSSAAGAGGDAEWSQVDLPLDLAPLEARYGNALALGGLDVAAGPGGVVASVNLQAYPDAELYAPDGVDLSGGWSWTAEGLVVYASGNPVTDAPATTAPPAEASGRPGEANTIASYTWDQLGIDGELRSLIQGELRVFASSDGAGFEEVDLPFVAAGTSTIVATDAGFALFAQTWPQDGSSGEVQVLRSSDGREWTADPAATFSGYLDSAGRVDGRAAVVTVLYGVEGRQTTMLAHVEQADGSWAALDISAAVPGADGTAAVSGATSAVGPMGIAAWVWVYDSAHDDAPAHQHVVFSPDGRSTATVEVTEQVGRGFPSAVFVSADAVFAGYSVPRTEPAAEPTMGLLVGTPAG